MHIYTNKSLNVFIMFVMYSLGQYMNIGISAKQMHYMLTVCCLGESNAERGALAGGGGSFESVRASSPGGKSGSRSSFPFWFALVLLSLHPELFAKMLTILNSRFSTLG